MTPEELAIYRTRFRAAYPVFSEEEFPDTQVDWWLINCDWRFNKDRWAELYELGLFLLVAHNLTLQKASSLTPTSGMDAAAGPISGTSRSAGGVSISTSRTGNSATASSGAGQYNLTVYGQQYWDLARLVGAGAEVMI